MDKLLKPHPALRSKFPAPILLVIIVAIIYYKLFLFGKIPFPGDLMVASYSPWFDYYKMPVQNPLISDVFSQFYIWKHLGLELIKNYEWPLWNPYSFIGTPLLATYHSAALYPLNFLILLPGQLGWGMFIASQSFVAVITMYILLGIWLKSKIARVIGAIIFAFAGPMTTWAEIGTAGHAMAWLPLSLFSLESFLLKSKIRFLALLALSQTLTTLAGNPQITLYSSILPIFYLIFRIEKWDIQIFKSKIIPVIVAYCIILALSAPQLLPSYELLQKSIRQADNYTESSNFGLLPLSEFPKFFIPDFFGNPVTRNYWGFLNYSETSSFIGSSSLILIIFAFCYLKRTRVVCFLLITLVASLILTFQNPISQLIYGARIPLLTQSYASRMLFTITFLASILCAFSVNQILEEGQNGKFRKSIILSAASFVGVLLGLLISQILSRPFSPNLITVSFRNSLLPAFYVFCTLAVSVFLTHSAYRQKILIGLIALFITLDMGRYFLKFNPFVSKEQIFPTTPTLEFLRTQPGFFRIGREHAEILPPNTWAMYKLQSFEGYDPIYLNSYGTYMHFLNGGEFDTGSADRYAELSGSYRSPFIDMLNVRYFVAIGKDVKGQIPGSLLDKKIIEAGYNKAFQDQSAVVLENSNASERAYFARKILQLPNEYAKKIIFSGNFNPMKETLVENTSVMPKVTGRGTVEILHYSSNRITIFTENEQEEVLILADQYDDGWKAKINGQNTKILKANFILRAVSVPPGKNTIEFNFLPASFQIGLYISGVGVGLVLVIMLIAYLKNKL